MAQSEPPENTAASPPLPRRAVLYTYAARTASHARQEEALRLYAGTHGFTIADVYSDTGERSARERLVTDAQADMCDAVLITERNCLARDAEDYDRIRDVLTEVSVRLIVLSDEEQL